MSHMTPLFAALSDPVRLAIVEQLMRDGETPAGTIAARFAISAPAVSRHLSVLLKSGMVARRVAGKQRLYSVRAEAVQHVAEWALDHRAFWEASLDRLEERLREDPQ